jgi:hypothetical protein
VNHAPACLLVLALAACTSKETETGPDGSVGRSVPPQSPGGSAHDGKGPAPSLRESVEYYDGAAKRKLWLSDDLVAEFDPSDAGRDTVLRADPSAKEVEQTQKGVRIWRVRAGLGAAGIGRGATLRVSPVLHEGPSPGMPMRALPGGVVATFQADWTRERIDAWLAARSLRVESEVSAEAHMFLVATPPGLDAIRIANELHETGELVDATPNFWQQATTR